MNATTERAVDLRLRVPLSLAEEFARLAASRGDARIAALIDSCVWEARSGGLREALDAFADAFSAESHPEWATPDDISRWARQVRGKCEVEPDSASEA